MQVKSIAECSQGAFCNTFRPSFSARLSNRSLLCISLSGCFRQVLLYSPTVGNKIKYRNNLLRIFFKDNTVHIGQFSKFATNLKKNPIILD